MAKDKFVEDPVMEAGEGDEDQFDSLAERLRLRTNKKPTFVEKGAEEEELQEKVDEEAGDKDDKTLELLKKGQVGGALPYCPILAQMTLQQNVESIEARVQGALTQAVKEIFEQLGKEAAAQVIMAERKASIVEQEHIYTKQQALAMMLRIKHTSDTLLMVERKRSQELEAKVAGLQDKIKKMNVDLKRKGEFLEEMQRQELQRQELQRPIKAGAGEVGKPGMMSPSEGVTKKRKGSVRVRPCEVKASQPEDVITVEDGDDSAIVLASVSIRSPSATDQPSPSPVRGTVRSAYINFVPQEHSQTAPGTFKQASQSAVRRNIDEGPASRSLGQSKKEANQVAGRVFEHRKTIGSNKGIRRRNAGADEVVDILDFSDQHDNNLEGRGQAALRKSNNRVDPKADSQDIDCMDVGALALVTLQASAPTSGAQDIPTGQSAIRERDGSSQGCDPFSRPKLKGGREDELASDSSTADEEELKQGEAGGWRPTISSHSMRHSCEEAASNHDAGTTTEEALFSGEVEQTMKNRRTIAGSKRRRKQQVSPEKPGGLVLKEKETKPVVDTRAAESSGSPKVRGPLVDAQEGSSSLIVETSRDSRRLMQGARQEVVAVKFWQRVKLLVGGVKLIPSMPTPQQRVLSIFPSMSLPIYHRRQRDPYTKASTNLDAISPPGVKLLQSTTRYYHQSKFIPRSCAQTLYQFHLGKNVGNGKDYTIYLLIDGLVKVGKCGPGQEKVHRSPHLPTSQDEVCHEIQMSLSLARGLLGERRYQRTYTAGIAKNRTPGLASSIERSSNFHIYLISMNKLKVQKLD